MANVPAPVSTTDRSTRFKDSRKRKNPISILLRDMVELVVVRAVEDGRARLLVPE